MVQTSQRPKKVTCLKARVNSCPSSCSKACAHPCTWAQTDKHKRDVQNFEKAFELLTVCSKQAISDECQYFINMIAVKLRNYDTIWCAIQNEIMCIFLRVNRGILWILSFLLLRPNFKGISLFMNCIFLLINVCDYLHFYYWSYHFFTLFVHLKGLFHCLKVMFFLY
jgi:hypothetical protein